MLTFQDAYIRLTSASGGVKSSERYLANHDQELFQFISQLHPQSGLSFKSKCISLRRGFEVLPLCHTCGKSLFTEETATKFGNGKHYSLKKYCSPACAGHDARKVEAAAAKNRGKPGSMTGRKLTPEQREKISASKRGKIGSRAGCKISEASRERMRAAVRARIAADPLKYSADCRKGYLRKVSSGFAVVGHNYNTSSIPYLKEIAEQLAPRECFYAPQEKAIRISKGVYKYPDFYCEDLKLIIEWDEEHHFNKENQEQDLAREEAITNSLGREWLIFRIRAKDYERKSSDERQLIIQEVIDRRS